MTGSFFGREIFLFCCTYTRQLLRESCHGYASNWRTSNAIKRTEVKKDCIDTREMKHMNKPHTSFPQKTNEITKTTRVSVGKIKKIEMTSHGESEK